MSPPPTSAAVTILDWGRTEYADALSRQSALVERRIAGGIGDTLIFTEHDPVFTLGMRAGAESNLRWEPDRRAREGIATLKTNRGGDITYHGPGQIVGYPIVALDARRDLHAYLRLLEEVLIQAVGRFGLAAERREGKTGIWIGRRKVAAIGVAVRRWVTYHGFALNVDPDLRHFDGIVPCGIRPEDGTVTSLRRELGRAVELADVKSALAAEFALRLPAFLAPAAP